jgi:hypothetical protein
LLKALGELRDEFDRLVDAVHAEEKRRGRKLGVSNVSGGKQRIESVPLSLTSGKLNVVRAAFKAGVKPSQIARLFSVSQADVRKAMFRGSASGC